MKKRNRNFIVEYIFNNESRGVNIWDDSMPEAIETWKSINRHATYVGITEAWYPPSVAEITNISGKPVKLTCFYLFEMDCGPNTGCSY